MKQNLFSNFTDFIDSAVSRGARFCPDWAIFDDDSKSESATATLDETQRDAQEFAEALEKYRLVHRRRAVSYEEALSVLKSLGYRKDPSN